MSEPVVVGLDFGSSRIKAAAYRRDGALVAARSVATPIRSTPDGDDFVVLDMLNAAVSAIAELGLPTGSIEALGTSSMGEVGTILADGGLADLAFPSWYDHRGGEIVAQLERAWGADSLRLSTGNHLRLTSTVAKLGHLASTRELPAGMFLGLCGALAWQLTGRGWQEAGLAVTSGVYDSTRRRYLEHVWETAGLGGIALPPVESPGACRAGQDGTCPRAWAGGWRAGRDRGARSSSRIGRSGRSARRGVPTRWALGRRSSRSWTRRWLPTLRTARRR